MNSILRKSGLLALLVIAVGCDKDPANPGPQPPAPPASEAELVQELGNAYRTMDLAAFTNLFPTAAEAEYLFLLNEPDPNDGSTSWGRDVELHVHQRMFRPQDTPGGENPVPPDLHLTELAIALTPIAPFEHRTDLYQPAGALDPAHWRASEAEYHATLYFGTVGYTDYAADCRVNFIVIDDLTKTVGDDRKFLLYRWEDLGSFSKPASEQKSWSALKSLYGS